MSIVAEMTIDALRDLGTPPLPHYESALTKACEKSPPPYGQHAYGEVYRKIAVDPAWMATSLMTSAEREGDGANRLWSLAASTNDEEISAQVKQHAIDEARHSRFYIALLDQVFPDAVEDSLRGQLKTLSPDYYASTPLKAIEGSPFSRPVTLDDLIQMNIAEIRTRIHHLLQRPVLMAYCPPESRKPVTHILDLLLVDETRHIAYTAELIEKFALDQQEESVHALMAERLHDFNDVTNEELANGVFDLT